MMNSSPGSASIAGAQDDLSLKYTPVKPEWLQDYPPPKSVLI